MAVYSMTATRVEIAGTNWADHGVSCELSVDAEPLDTTNFASSGWHEEIGGIKSATLTMTFNDDFAASNIDATVFANLGSLVAVKVRPTADSVTATNPEFRFSSLVSQHRFGGGVGALAQKSLTWNSSGTVTRATS